ncbi:MAG: two-component regulator propeller domain-containing protein [Spirosomataceae bacterium]
MTFDKPFPLFFFRLFIANGCWIMGLGISLGQTYRIEHIGTDRGLSQGSVYAHLKDSRGFMWFGTQDGLNRFDGHTFKVYYSEPDVSDALQGGIVNAIVEAPNGDLWIGTDYGLNQYHRQSDTFTFIPSSSSVELSSCTPFATNHHAVWYWSEKEGIIQYNYIKHKKKTILPAINYRLGLLTTTNGSAFGKDGKLWVCLTEGLMQYDTLSKKETYFFSRNPQNIVGKPTILYCVNHAKNGLIYLGYADGLLIFNPQNNQIKYINQVLNKPLGEVYGISESNDGGFWLATSSNGVLRYASDGTWQQWTHQKNNPNSLANNTISTVYEANDGIVWTNPDPLGVDAMIGYGYKFNSVRYVAEETQSLNDPNVRCLLSFNKNLIWIGTEQGGINLWDKNKQRITAYIIHDPKNPRSLPSQSINQFLRDRNDQVWVATYNGLGRYVGNGQFENFYLNGKHQIGQNIVRSIAEWKPNQLLIGTEYGLYVFHKHTHVFTPIKGLENQNIIWLSCTDNQTIWLTPFNNGCLKGSIKNNQWTTNEVVAKHGNVLCMLPDSARHCTWFGSSNGLLQYKNGEIIKRFTVKDGLPNSYIYATLTDRQHNIWISTNRGLASFNPEKQQFRNYQLSDGLHGYEFNNKSYLIDSSGVFYFGGTTGFTYFKPEEVRTSTFQPKVQLTDFWIDEKHYQNDMYIGETQSIQLHYDHNTFSIFFSALDFFSNGQNQYQYRLKGWENEWITTQNAFARYVRVPASDYVFEVKAANSDGFWSDDIRQLTIRIKPPFWQTWWFRLMAALGITALGALFYRWRILSLKQRQKQRLDLIIKTQEAERKQLATELHDDLGMRLSTLQIYVAELEKDQEKRTNQLKPVLEEAIRGIRQLIHDLNPKLLFEQGLHEALEDLIKK